MDEKARIGVDLGGTKIEGVVLDPRGEILARERLPTPAGDYDRTVEAIAGLVATLEREALPAALVGALPLGVGTPGAISPATGLLKNSNSVCLNGRPLREDLARRLARPVRLANDANCFALSEAVDGAAAGAGLVFGVILGTGVGGGVVFRTESGHRAWDGPNAIGGEWGHNPLPAPADDERPGPPCYCGRSGCIETWCSGPGLARDHARATGQRLSANDIAKAAAEGEPGASASLQRYVSRLGRALAGLVNILDPEVIVLGGGLSNVEALYGALPAAMAPCVFSDRVDTRIVPPMHGDSSGVRGAAWLW